MAVDKLVDSTQLDADLTSVANAIRTKGGTSASLAFPVDFVSAIGAIPSGGGGGGGDLEWTEIVSAARYTNAAVCAYALFGPFSASANLVKIAYLVDKSRANWSTDQLVILAVTEATSQGGTYGAAGFGMRYRNGSIATMAAGSSYDAVIEIGDKYKVATLDYSV